MFFKEFFKNKWNIVILVGSVLSIIPIIVLVHNALDLIKAGDVGYVNEAFIKSVLSRTILYWSNLLSLVLGVVVWVTNSAISAWGIHNKRIRPLFAYTSLAFGGVMLHFFVLLGYYFKSKSKREANKRIKTTVLTTSLLVFAAIPVATFSFALGKKSFDAPVVGKDIEISFESDKPNMVEIFTDGFDKRFSDAIQNDSNFDDFYIFDKFQAEGIKTHFTVPTLYDGFSRNNPFSVALNRGITPDKYIDWVYGGHWLESGMEHIKDSNYPYFGQRSIVNPVTLSANRAYGATTSGTPKEIKEIDPEVNVTNWAGARDDNYGSWGISNISPDRNSYKWLGNHLTEAKPGSKGARVYMADMLTHRPFLNNADGNFSSVDISFDDNKNVLFKSLGELISSLKNMKNPKLASNPNEKIKTAYDNTMFVVYGDHASHEMLFDELDENGKFSELESNVRKTESLMIIKYPQITKPTNRVISDRYLYSGQLNSIISDYFTNHIDKLDAIDYFKNQKFENVPRPTFIQTNHYVMSNWQGDKLVVSKDANGNKLSPVYINLEHNALKAQVDELTQPSKVVYYE